MKKLSTPALCLAIVVCSPSLNAQDASLGTYLHGNWTIKGMANGEEVSGNMFVRPAADGASQVYRWTVRYPDEVRTGSAIAGIDPETGKVVEHAFGEGFYWKNTYDQVLGDGLGQATGTREGMVRGEKEDATISVDRTSTDQFHYKVESGGKTDVDFVFSRVVPGTDGEEAFKAYADLAVGGTWTTTIDGVTYEDTYTRIQDGAFVMLTSKPAGDFPASISILGVDPVTKKFTWWGFAADGTVSSGTSKQMRDGVWVGPFNGKGPKGEMTSRGRLTRVDENTIKYDILEEERDPDVPGFAKSSIWKRTGARK
jgi:hypothetical protein